MMYYNTIQFKYTYIMSCIPIQNGGKTQERWSIKKKRKTPCPSLTSTFVKEICFKRSNLTWTNLIVTFTFITYKYNRNYRIYFKKQSSSFFFNEDFSWLLWEIDSIDVVTKEKSTIISIHPAVVEREFLHGWDLNDLFTTINHNSLT